MKKRGDFDYRKAEADLDGVGAHHPDEIYSYRSEKAIRGYMKEHGLNPDKYYKPDGDKSPFGAEEDGGCYLTSACVAARGLPDDCDALQILRAFRDGVLARRSGGRAEIEQYYRMAPGIVAAINRRADAGAIWERVYDELVEPCARLILAGREEEAHRLYKAYALALAELSQ